MAAQMHNTADEMRRLLAEGAISEDALHRITGIAVDGLRRFLEEVPSGTPRLLTTPQPLTDEETTRLSVLTPMLSNVHEIDDDERLRGILESLTRVCGVTPANIARLTGVAIDVVEAALDDPHGLPLSAKYTLALRGSYLINAANLARRDDG